MLRLSARYCWLSFVQIPIAVIYSFLFFKNHSTHYVVICDHIGDFVLTAGYLHEFKKSLRSDTVTLVTIGKFKPLFDMYQFNKSYRFQSVFQPFLHLLMSMGKTAWGQRALLKFANVTIINPVNDFTTGTFDYISRFPHITFKDCIKYGLLKLPASAKYTPPIYKVYKSSPIWKRFRFPLEKTIILAPYASILSVDSWDVFELLTDALTRQGYMVLTNITSKKQHCIQGTSPLICSLDEILYIAEHTKCIIGLRSGLFDLLAYHNCTVIALYPQNYTYNTFFTLLSLEQTRAKISECQLTGKAFVDSNQILNLLT